MRSNKYFLGRCLAICVAVLVAACHSPTAKPNETDVYDALFNELGSTTQTYVILEVPIDPTSEFGYQTPLVDDEKISYTRGKQLFRAGDFGLNKVIVLGILKNNEIFADEPSCAEGWIAFHKAYPGSNALIQLSRVGFTSDGLKAEVIISASGDCWGGRRSALEFVRHKGRWQFSKAT
jgi:hypothetical protein